MNGAIEAAGEFATGTAWARTAEPVAGEARDDAHGGACLNCGTTLTGRYCHECGQSSHVHKTLMSIVHDLLHGVFHFEGKIWRTVPMLVLHPGKLTRRYIDGERAKFVSPLALFLFTVFLMFAVYSAVGPGDLSDGLAQGFNNTAAGLARAEADNGKQLADLERQRAALAARRQSTTAVDARMANLRQDLASMTAVRQRLQTRQDHSLQVHSKWAWLEEGVRKARQNPGLTIYKVQSAAYKFSWALIFLSTPFVALLFLWRRRFGLYDHATFVTYSITFMSLLVIVLELLLTVNAPGALIAMLAVFGPPVHMFVQLRGAYGLSVFSALWRTVMLLFGALFTLLFFVIGVVMLEVAH